MLVQLTVKIKETGCQLKAVDIKVKDKNNGKVIVLHLTPVVEKDVYLLVSGSRVINFDTSLLQERDLQVG